MSKEINIPKDRADLIKAGNALFGSIEKKQEINGLNAEQSRALAIAVSARESSNDKKIINPYGYLGLFQFGAEALANVGLIKKANIKHLLKKYPKGKDLYSRRNGEPSPHEKFLRDDNNWILPGGLKSYLSDVDIQYKAFIDNTNSNIKMGMRVNKTYKKNSNGKKVVDKIFSPALNESSSAAKIAGFAMSAHMKPLGAIKYYALGVDDRDGNKTLISSYAKLGEEAVTMLAPNLEGYQYKNVLSSDGNDESNATYSLSSKLESEGKEHSSISQPLPLTQEIKDKFKNTLYKYGANGNQVNGNTLYDCSHLTHALGKELGHNVPYQSTAELAKSKYYDIIDPKDVKPGDLALWRGKDNHVGVVETPIGSDGTGTYFSTRGNDKKPGRSGTVKFGPKSGYWKKPTSYLRIKPEYVNQAPIKNTVVAQKKSSPPKVAPAPVVEKNSADIAKEKKLPRGYDLLGGMVSALRQLTVPNLQHATQALLGRQPEDYRSAKGGCCCASGPTSPVINQNTSITLNSACKDPQELGKIVTSAQDRVNRDMVRKITPRTS